MKKLRYMKFREGKWQRLDIRALTRSATQLMKKMFSWIAENGKMISGPVREVYLNDPREVNPDEILTEIYALWFDTRNLILKQE